MITNKSTAVRSGFSSRWPVSFNSNDHLSYTYGLAFSKFFDTFFSDSLFRDRGVIFSHSILRSRISSISLHTFSQDAKLVDFVNTFPRRSIFTGRPLKYNKFRYNVSSTNSQRFSKNPQYRTKSGKFFFRKKRLFFSERNYLFSNSPRLMLARTINSKNLILFSRTRRVKKFSHFFQTYFINHSNIFLAFKSSRLRYYSFLARLMSYFLSFSTGVSFATRFNHLLPRQATASFYLNYVCTKLYYRYILNDVINPIVRMSLRYYRGFTINCKGRFTRAQIASQKTYKRGSMGFSSMHNDLDYSQKSVILKYGACNLKLWIRKLFSNHDYFKSTN